ncbi:MAG TPA: MaoC family dehydratase N-terminal domain-containing protein [Chloroflexota bacterium]|nr:MaoC family dehydratase N-terminal domain-containing protein [Chloroflexota bacterium]
MEKDPAETHRDQLRESKHPGELLGVSPPSRFALDGIEEELQRLGNHDQHGDLVLLDASDEHRAVAPLLVSQLTTELVPEPRACQAAGLGYTCHRAALPRMGTEEEMQDTASKGSVTLADLEPWLGRESEFEGLEEVSRNDIRRKLEVYCFDCPLHYDDAVAQAHGYRMIVAPLAMTPLWALPPYWVPGEPPPFAPGRPERNGSRHSAVPSPFSKGFNAASEWESFEPLYPGDRLRVVTKLVKIDPKETRVGNGAFLTHETGIYKRTGELVLVSRSTQYRYDPHEERVQEARSAPVEQPPTTMQPQESSPDVDWSRQTYFEDVAVGQEIPPYHIWLNYQRIVMSVAADRMFGSIHHNRELARAAGLDDIIFNTRGYEMVFEITLRRWMGLDGRIKKMGPFRMVKNSHPGDTLTGRARVVDKELRDGAGIVQLEIGVDNPRAEAARGSATVALPLRSR